ncbi:hypothetical protein ABIB38_004307 [Massilia sp. UYP11]|uniref:hypothetical protein n=1 Tax=Massilia sp. UYP11 TaxID=1756385 RepID=UPI003D259038
MDNEEWEKNAAKLFVANYAKNISERQKNGGSYTANGASQSEEILDNSLTKDFLIILFQISAIVSSCFFLTLEQSATATLMILASLLIMAFFKVKIESKAVLNLMGLLILHAVVLSVVGCVQSSSGMNKPDTRQESMQSAGV